MHKFHMKTKIPIHYVQLAPNMVSIQQMVFVVPKIVEVLMNKITLRIIICAIGQPKERSLLVLFRI